MPRAEALGGTFAQADAVIVSGVGQAVLGGDSAALAIANEGADRHRCQRGRRRRVRRRQCTDPERPVPKRARPGQRLGRDGRCGEISISVNARAGSDAASLAGALASGIGYYQAALASEAVNSTFTTSGGAVVVNFAEGGSGKAVADIANSGLIAVVAGAEAEGSTAFATAWIDAGIQEAQGTSVAVALVVAEWVVAGVAEASAFGASFAVANATVSGFQQYANATQIVRQAAVLTGRDGGVRQCPAAAWTGERGHRQ